MKSFCCCLLLFIFSLPVNILAQPASVVLYANEGSPAVFPSITSAYSAIPYSSTKDYTIEIQSTYKGSDPTESYPITFFDKGLSGKPQTITIRPAASNLAAVIQQPVSRAGAVIRFSGATNVILDGRPGGQAALPDHQMKILQAGTGLPQGTSFSMIELADGAHHNHIQYLEILAPSSPTGIIHVNLGGGNSATNLNTLAHNKFSGGKMGINGIMPSSGFNDGNKIEHNSFEGCSETAISLAGCLHSVVNDNNISFSGHQTDRNVLEGIRIEPSSKSTTVSNNTINLSTGSFTITAVAGINIKSFEGNNKVFGNNIIALHGAGGLTITGIVIHPGQAGNASFAVYDNRIQGLRTPSSAIIKGLEVLPSHGNSVDVYNNFIALSEANAASAGVFGMVIGNGSGAAFNAGVYFNSVWVAGTGNSAGSAGLWVHNTNVATVYNQKNNLVLVSRNGGIAFSLQETAGSLSIDHNNYYAPLATSGFSAGWNVLNHPSGVFANNALTDYKAFAFPHEQHTTFADMQYVSSTDLHLSGTSINNPLLRGVAVAGITHDIDNNMRSLSQPAKGADEPGGPVPVQLFMFTGVSKGVYNQLNWSTASESNNKGFELQRSGDGLDFVPVGFVPSRSDNGSSTSILHYSLNDLKPFTTVSYYRLKQIDKDGRSLYSAIIAIRGKGVNRITITNLYPNPAGDKTTLVVASARAGTITLWVTDLAGRTYIQENIKIKTGDNIIPVNTSHFGKGGYLLRITHQHTLETTHIQFMK